MLDLAGAVKELVENALDAGATNIEVRLRDHGQESVEVVDNGCGVKSDDLAMMTKKYATSKIRHFGPGRVGVVRVPGRGALVALRAQ